MSEYDIVGVLELTKEKSGTDTEETTVYRKDSQRADSENIAKEMERYVVCVAE